MGDHHYHHDSTNGKAVSSTALTIIRVTESGYNFTFKRSVSQERKPRNNLLT